MTGSFFELASPKDMFEKARREFDVMKTRTTADSVFNFFVTAYHVMDYVKNCSPQIPQPEIDAMFKDDDFQLCNLICNKGKHLTLTRIPPTSQPEMEHSFGSMYGTAMYGKTQYGEPERFLVVVDGKKWDVIPLGERVLDKWNSFLKKNVLI